MGSGEPVESNISEPLYLDGAFSRYEKTDYMYASKVERVTIDSHFALIELSNPENKSGMVILSTEIPFSTTYNSESPEFLVSLPGKYLVTYNHGRSYSLMFESDYLSGGFTSSNPESGTTSLFVGETPDE